MEDKQRIRENHKQLQAQIYAIVGNAKAPGPGSDGESVTGSLKDVSSLKRYNQQGAGSPKPSPFDKF
jgi:hypothetical protein